MKIPNIKTYNEKMKIRELIVTIIILFSLFSITFIHCNDTSEESISFPPELIAYWDFNTGSGKILYDITENENHGVINGATWVDGIEGKALSFDGVDDYVEIGDSPGWDSAQKTISAWLYPIANNDNGEQMKAIWREGYTDNSGFQITFKDSIYWANFHVGSWKGASSSGNVGEWAHIVAVNNGSNVLIYTNGSLATGDSCGESSPGSYPIRIGRWNSTGRDWNGYIDEVRVYNRALDSAEIQDLYSQFF